MKKIILFAIAIFTFSFLRAQLNEEAVFGHYLINPTLINPAKAGFSESSQAFMNIRSSWSGFDGAPTTYAISYNGAAGEILGLGLNVLSENVASLTRFRFQGTAAFRFQISDDIKVASGLTMEISQRRLSDAILDNPFYESGDQVIEANVDGVRYYDSSFGLFGNYKNSYAGISFPNMIVSKLNDISAANDSASTFLKSVIGQVGHTFEFGEIKVEPSLGIFKINDLPLRVDVNVLAKFLEEKFTAGASFRYAKAPFENTLGGNASVLVGAKVTAFQLFYSYDIYFLEFQQYNSGSHEVTIAFDFKNESNGRRRRKF